MFKRLFATLGYVPAASVAITATTTVDRVALFQGDVTVAAEALSGDYDYRSLRAVRKALGLAKRECPYVVAVLKATGARPSYHNKNKWGLKSHIGETGRRAGSRRY